MKVPPEITYRNVDKTAAIDTLINEKIAKLEQLCDYISSCQIAIEKVHDRPRSGSPYRARIDLTLPPSHELVADSNPSDNNQYVELDAVIRDAFRKMERQLKQQIQQQRESEKTKSGSATDTTALVVRLFRAEGYGFLRSLEGEEIYFHCNSVLHNDFDRLELGTGVRFEAEDGEQGPQATSVQIVDKPGANAGEAEQSPIEPPLGWQA